MGALKVLWLDVDDPAGPESARAYLERNAIGLLSFAQLPGRVEGWLGQHSNRALIRESGLWNQRSVGERHASAFLDQMARYVAST